MAVPLTAQVQVQLNKARSWEIKAFRDMMCTVCDKRLWRVTEYLSLCEMSHLLLWVCVVARRSLWQVGQLGKRRILMKPRPSRTGSTVLAEDERLRVKRSLST